MRKTTPMPGIRRLLGLISLAALTALVVAGCIRYGGPEGAVDRARAKVSEIRPHPSLVPTPFIQGASESMVLPALSQNPGTSPLATPVPASPTVQVTSTSTASSTATHTSTALPSPTPTATPAFIPAQPSVALTGITHSWQDWNNCGPTTLAMNLGYYGSKLSQYDAAAVMKPDKDDKNVGPNEMAAYAQSKGFQALVRVNGNPDRLRLLLSNGVPVIVETWMQPKPNDGMGHYRLLTGYDDASRQWIVYDSYESRGLVANAPYAGIRIPYDEIATLWRAFDRTYIVIYTDKEAAVVASILGQDMDDAAMWQRALGTTEAELKDQKGDAFGWFNLGTELVAVGNYQDAAAAYDQARQLGLPWRMLWYQFGPFQAYNAVGRYQEMVALADDTLKQANIEELFYWKGVALKAQGDLAGARQAWQRAVQLKKNYAEPAEALAALGQ